FEDLSARHEAVEPVFIEQRTGHAAEGPCPQTTVPIHAGLDKICVMPVDQLEQALGFAATFHSFTVRGHTMTPREGDHVAYALARPLVDNGSDGGNNDVTCRLQ